jgi:hypothetical protein
MSALWLAEKVLCQLISVNYHAKANAQKIREIKDTSRAVDLLYAASLRRFIDHHPDFQEEDWMIHDTSNVQRHLSDKGTRRFFANLRSTADNVTSAFGAMASDMTGTTVFRPTATHAIVEGALERASGSEALARRIFKSLCRPGSSTISESDLVEELGVGQEDKAHWIFSQLDGDGNGDVSLEEMILLICGIAKQREDMWKSACDIKDAIKVLDHVLSFIVFVIVCLFYGSFSNQMH